LTATQKLTELFRAVGPGWLVMIADVDAASIITAAETGAVYHYGLIWLLLLLIVPLFFIQEASGRIGVVTRKGLGEIMRESYSRRIALLAAVPMALTDVLTYVAEYVGIAIGMELLGIPPVVSVPVAYLLHVLLVYRRGYLVVEKVMLGISAILLLSYIGSLFIKGTMNYPLFYFSLAPSFLFLVAANAGAVVMPFMPFYQASATAQKKSGTVRSSRIETLVGAITSEILMVIIVVVSTDLGQGLSLLSPKQLAGSLAVAGQFAPILFGVGLVAAAFLALTVISLGSAWGLVEAIGWPRSRAFWVYFVESIPAVIITIVLTTNLLEGIINLMLAFVFVLIGPAVITGLIASNQQVMGENVSNGFWKAAYWLNLAFLVALGIVSVVTSLL
jgi:Mn2+/Fe2+ NRAMP family transporter